MPVRQRGARLDDALHVIGDLLTGRPVALRGAGDAPSTPRPCEPPWPPRPRSTSAAAARRRCRRAARHGDMWLPMWLTPDRVAERTQLLADLAELEGRPAPGTALLIGVHIDDDRARARAEAELHIRGQYRMGLDKIEHWTLLDSVDGAVEQLEAYSQAGVEEFAVDAARPRAPHPVRAPGRGPRGSLSRRPRPRGRPQGPRIEQRGHLPLRPLGLPRGVRAPLHLPRRRLSQQPPLRPPPRAARPGHGSPLDLRGAVGRHRAAGRRSQGSGACERATWSCSTCSTAPSSCSCGSPPSGWARSRLRSTSASPPARWPTSWTTAARRPSSTTPALAKTAAADALARASSLTPAHR